MNFSKTPRPRFLLKNLGHGEKKIYGFMTAWMTSITEPEL